MCGICGFSASPSEHADVRALAKAMLVGIENRGRHATGLAWEQDGRTWLAKDPVPASTFITGLPERIADTRTFIGHTRWATHGSPSDNANNHPIDVHGIVGVHNGVLANDDALFAEIGHERRIAEVDSEAAFAYLLHARRTVPGALSRIKGSAALAWFDVTEPDTLHLARVSSSPLIIARTAAGSLLFASTEDCIRTAATAAGMDIATVYPLNEGVYLEVRDGEIVGNANFTTAARGVLSDLERGALSNTH